MTKSMEPTKESFDRLEDVGDSDIEVRKIGLFPILTWILIDGCSPLDEVVTFLDLAET